MGTFDEVRNLSLPQIRLVLAGCDRRDAALALKHMDAVHAANAPIHCGSEGTKVFKATADWLRSIIRPGAKVASNVVQTLRNKMEMEAIFAPDANPPPVNTWRPKPEDFVRQTKK